MSMARVEEEPTLYVPVLFPSELRKDLLGCIKKNLVLLKRYEQYRQVRKEKVERIAELRTLLKEIDYLTRRLMKVLPKTHLRSFAKPQKVEQPKKEKRPESKRDLTELEKIEAELQHVESKIKGLG